MIAKKNTIKTDSFISAIQSFHKLHRGHLDEGNVCLLVTEKDNVSLGGVSLPRWIKRVETKEFLSPYYNCPEYAKTIVVCLEDSTVSKIEPSRMIQLFVSYMRKDQTLVLFQDSEPHFFRDDLLAHKYFDFVMNARIKNENTTIEQSLDESNALVLREPHQLFPDLTETENAALRISFIEGPASALSFLKVNNLKRANTYPAVRLWNKLILDMHEKEKACSVDIKEPRQLVGLWDYRFVPTTLGDFFYFLSVLKLIREERNLTHIQIWCLLPNLEEIRFDQRVFSQELRQRRCRQIKGLTAFLPDSEFRLFLDSEQFDREIKEAPTDIAFAPRFESERGGMFASYVHCYRFMDRVYKNSGASPYIFPPGKVLEDAQSLVASIKSKEQVDYVFTVHIRKSSVDEGRNASLEEWIDFFNKTQETYSDVFFMVLGEGEVRTELEKNGSDNIFFASDHATGVLRDFTFIHASDGYIGGASGPSAVSLLSPIPYLFYKYKVINELPYVSLPNPFPWATELQKTSWLGYSTKSLYDEFIEWFEILKSRGNKSIRSLNQ